MKKSFFLHFTLSLLFVTVLFSGCKPQVQYITEKEYVYVDRPSDGSASGSGSSSVPAYTTDLSDNLMTSEYKYFGSFEWSYWDNRQFTFSLFKDYQIEMKFRPLTQEEIGGPYYELKSYLNSGNENKMKDLCDGKYYSKIYDSDSGTYDYIEDENGDYVLSSPKQKPEVSFYNKNWSAYSLSDVSFSSSVPRTWSNDKNDSHVTGFGMNTDKEYTVTITCNEKEAQDISSHGFIINGRGIMLQSVKVTKRIYACDTLEGQYEFRAQKRNDIIDLYKNTVGYDLPFIFVTVENNENVISFENDEGQWQKDYHNVIIDVLNCKDDYKLTQKGQFKVRGNSTGQKEPYPYRIKFDKKKNMLGLHNGKKYKSWVLLNTNGGMDYLGFNLAHKLYEYSDKFDYYASDATFVHVFVNEEYKGMRLLCEQNQVNSGRVDVYEPAEGSTQTKIGYMIELDNYAWSDRWWNSGDKGTSYENGAWKGAEEYHFSLSYKDLDTNEVPKLTDINGVERSIPRDDFSLKNDIYSPAQAEFVAKYMKGVWDICYNAIEKNVLYKFDSNYDLVPADSDATPQSVCDAVIDLDSLAIEMILEELVRDNDVGAGSLYMAVDFTKGQGQKYNKLTFECPWDFNWAYNTYTQDATYYADKLMYFAGAWQPKHVMESWYEGRSHPWFIIFNNAPWFREMLRAKWEQVGKAAIITACNNATTGAAAAETEGGVGINNPVGFVKNRIDYIDEYLWK